MKDDTVESFLRSLGDKSPTPGGGAVSALNGAIAAAQLKMVCEYSKAPEINQNTGFLSQKVEAFFALATADSEVFDKVSKAYKTKSSAEIDSTLVSAIQVSIDVVAKCEELIYFCENNYLKFNKNLKADLMVVLANLRAAIYSAEAMERTNLVSIKGKEPEGVKDHINFCEQLYERLDELSEKIEDQV